MPAWLTNMYAAEAEYLAAGGPGEASFELLAPFFASDVVLHQAEALPYGGTWRGHDGMERFFLAMSQAWKSFDMVDQECLASGRDRRGADAGSRPCPRHRPRIDFPILQAIDARRAHRRGRPFYWDTAAIARALTA